MKLEMERKKKKKKKRRLEDPMRERDREMGMKLLFFRGHR